MDRRNFIVTSGLSALFPSTAIGQTSSPSNPDVIVIGAGAAGVSASRELQRQGLSVTVIEADNRIGGRVYTDTSIFGAPYDVGAHWMHYREANPFVDYGLANGFDLYPAPDDELFFVSGKKATAAELGAYEAARKSALREISKAGRQNRDVAPAKVVPNLGDWSLTTNLYVGAYEMAKDFDHFSCADWYTGEDGTDWYCREGYGALFAHSARDVAVELNTTAETVGWSGTGVQVETNRGTIRGKALVITVSTGVLANGGIKFDPPLPQKKQEALNVLTMGHYHHVALQLKDNFFGTDEDGYFAYKISEESNGAPKGFGALVDASGHGITYCDIGGEFARQLSEQGTSEMYDFVISELKKAFGADIEKSVTRSHTFDWTKHRLTRGAYASAEPGGAWSRSELRQPVANRLWFAGEATSTDDWATVAGAHKSGVAAAGQVVQALQT